MDNDKISVILPVYNAEKYLNRCIDSIINQTYSNIEIIIINDGSTDNSSKIIHEYEKKDKRIRIIEKENRGVSDTRNVGIQNVDGKYIFFVDSDDYLYDKCLEILLFHLNKYNADIVRCNYYQNGKKKYFYEKNQIYNLEINEEKIMLYQEIYSSYKFNPVWGQLIRKNLIEKCKFDENLKMAEDFKFNLEIIENAKKVVLIDESLYFYEINYTGINFNNDLNKIKIKINDILNVYTELYKKEKNIEKNMICERFLKEIIPHIIEMSKCKLFNDYMTYLCNTDLCKKIKSQFDVKRLKKYKYYIIAQLLIKEKLKLLLVSCRLMLVVKNIKNNYIGEK